MFFFEFPGIGSNWEPGIYVVPEPVPKTLEPPKPNVESLMKQQLESEGYEDGPHF